MSPQNSIQRRSIHPRLLSITVLAVAFATPLAIAGDDGWRPLFDGESLAGWHGYHGTNVPDGWMVQDGTLHCTGGAGDDLVTDDQWSDFELSLEWKVSPVGNSGVFYLAVDGLDHIFMGAPEMQVLDDAKHPDGLDPLTSAGADYGLYPAPRGVVKPAGEWNAARIVVRGDDVEHWLNGQRIVSYTLGSEHWLARVAASKFAQWPTYGQSRRGRIGLQNHGNPVWFRNIRIREFD